MGNDSTHEDIKFSDRRRVTSEGEEREGAPADRPREETPKRAPENRSQQAEQYKLDFSSFVLSIGTAAMVELGEIEHPVSKKKEFNLIAAKHNIDILEILAEKTKGNLDSNENMLLENLLYEVRLKFIQSKERAKEGVKPK